MNVQEGLQVDRSVHLEIILLYSSLFFCCHYFFYIRQYVYLMEYNLLGMQKTTQITPMNYQCRL